MREQLEFVGYSLGYGFKLYKRKLIEPDSLCVLVIQNHGKLRRVTFESETGNVREAHQKAVDFLRDLEHSQSGYDMASLTYDGLISCAPDQQKSDALICQLFTLDSYANRRFIQCYIKDDRGFKLKDKPFDNGGWEEEPDSSIVYASLLQGLESQIVSFADHH